MKLECPQCGIVGTLQQRGNSYRVQHYQGFENGKRSYLYHKVSSMEVNGSKSMEVKKAISNLSTDYGQGSVVQHGKTSPSRGEDHRFKSGPAHHKFCQAENGVCLYLILHLSQSDWDGDIIPH
jgi:hypothetical protein